MYKIYAAANLQEAYLILHRLENADIAARIFNEHAHGALGEIPFTHAYPELWVLAQADLTRARAIVDEYQRAIPTTAAHACPACGESNPGDFELCWRCGATFERLR